MAAAAQGIASCVPAVPNANASGREVPSDGKPSPSGREVPREGSLASDVPRARANAARDIPCGASGIAAVSWVIPHSTQSDEIVVVEGCGQRLTYACSPLDCLLTSRIAVAPPQQPPRAAVP
jgi:hypothetical protein